MVFSQNIYDSYRIESSSEIRIFAGQISKLNKALTFSGSKSVHLPLLYLEFLLLCVTDLSMRRRTRRLSSEHAT